MSRLILVTRSYLLLLGVGLALMACEGSLTDPIGDEGERSQFAEEKVQRPSLPDSILETRILVDASNDGGVWWFPQSGPFVPGEDHQGRMLAEYLRSWGYEVEELARGALVTDSMLAAYKYVIRAGEWGSAHASELEAYARFVEREATLILLSDHRNTDRHDELAEMLGVVFSGGVDGTLSVAPHAITTGAEGVYYGFGAFLASYDSTKVEVLGWVNDSLPVMGTLKSTRAKVFFMGDTNTLEWVPQPLVDNLIAWGFGRSQGH
jgi:hypothetical protein